MSQWTHIHGIIRVETSSESTASVTSCTPARISGCSTRKSRRSMIRRYLPSGATRALWDDDWHPTHEPAVVPRRASRVEVVASGKQRGRFHVDFSLLGEDHRFCLLQTFKAYREAVEAERDWLLKNWVQASIEATHDHVPRGSKEGDTDRCAPTRKEICDIIKHPEAQCRKQKPKG